MLGLGYMRPMTCWRVKEREAGCRAAATTADSVVGALALCNGCRSTRAARAHHQGSHGKQGTSVLCVAKYEYLAMRAGEMPGASVLHQEVVG